jgi:hypothetical protein
MGQTLGNYSVVAEGGDDLWSEKSLWIDRHAAVSRAQATKATCPH